VLKLRGCILDVETCVDFSLPEKDYFKMAEACDLLGIRPHVLRYWETEFSQVKPHMSKSGQRLYRRTDVETLARIYQLLYRKKFTIAGAKQALRTMSECSSPSISEQSESMANVEIMSAIEQATSFADNSVFAQLEPQGLPELDASGMAQIHHESLMIDVPVMEDERANIENDVEPLVFVERPVIEPFMVDQVHNFGSNELREQLVIVRTKLEKAMQYFTRQYDGLPSIN